MGNDERTAGSGIESAVSVCNRALCLVGGTRMISSLLEASTEASLCSSVYGPALRSLLAEHPWSWCRSVEALPPASDVSVPDFSTLTAFRRPAFICTVFSTSVRRTGLSGSSQWAESG